MAQDNRAGSLRVAKLARFESAWSGSGPQSVRDIYSIGLYKGFLTLTKTDGTMEYFDLFIMFLLIIVILLVSKRLEDDFDAGD